MQNVYADDVLKRSYGYSNQTILSKREAKFLSQILLTSFSEEFLKVHKNPFTRASIFLGIIISRIEESKTIFSFSQKV